MSIIVEIWTTCPHLSNVAPYAETSTTDNVPYAELPQTGQTRFTAPSSVQPDNPEVSSEAVAKQGWASSWKPDLGTSEADYRPVRMGPARFRRNGALPLAQESSETIVMVTTCDTHDRTVWFWRSAVASPGDSCPSRGGDSCPSRDRPRSNISQPETSHRVTSQANAEHFAAEYRSVQPKFWT